MKKIFLLLLVFALTYNNYAQENQAVIAFYNLENLFDTINDPNKNDEEFLPEGRNQWTGDRYQRKLQHLSKVISQIGVENGCPVVLGVSEIENEKVLLDLADQDLLKSYHYKVAHHDSPDRRGVDVAFLYQSKRFELLSLKAFRLNVPDKPDFITRDQVLITGVLDNIDTLNLIVLHWPSKSGGEARSIPLRVAAAKLSRSIADSILNVNPKANIILLGDLNDVPTAKSFKEALKPVSKISDMTPKDLFNPMWKMYHDGIGSYLYQDSWEMLDQIILSYNLVYAPQNHYKYSQTHVFYKSFMMTKTGSFAGYPFRTYAGGTYQGGYSDHFPVYIILKK